MSGQPQVSTMLFIDCVSCTKLPPPPSEPPSLQGQSEQKISSQCKVACEDDCVSSKQLSAPPAHPPPLQGQNKQKIHRHCKHTCSSSGVGVALRSPSSCFSFLAILGPLSAADIVTSLPRTLAASRLDHGVGSLSRSEKASCRTK